MTHLQRANPFSFLRLPLLHPAPPFHPIHPTPIIHPHPGGIIPRLQRQLRRRARPHARLAVEHDRFILDVLRLARLVDLEVLLRGRGDAGFGKAEPGFEFLGGEEEGVGLGGEGDGERGGDDPRGGELGGFADVDEDGAGLGGGGGGGSGGEGGVDLAEVCRLLYCVAVRWIDITYILKPPLLQLRRVAVSQLVVAGGIRVRRGLALPPDLLLQQ